MRTGEVTPNFRDQDMCQCELDDCELWGTLGRPDRNGRRHVRGCACRVCLGRRNRRKGLSKQSAARKRLGVGSSKFSDANEETWHDRYFANEVKAGGQVGPLVNWWRRVEAQVLANEADFGDRRRAVRAVAMPDGWGKDGLVVVRLSTWETHIGPALKEFYGSES